MHWLTRLTLLLIAASLTFISAAVFLIYQYKLGIPYNFATNMTLATVIGLVAPLVAMFAVGLLIKEARAPLRFAAYYAVCIIVTGVISVLTF